MKKTFLWGVNLTRMSLNFCPNVSNYHNEKLYLILLEIEGFQNYIRSNEVEGHSNQYLHSNFVCKIVV